MLIKIQPDATVCRYLFTAKLLYMFRASQRPSSGVLKTVTAAFDTGHDTGTATSLQRGPTVPFGVPCVEVLQTRPIHFRLGPHDHFLTNEMSL